MPSVMKASAEVSPWLREVDKLKKNPEKEWPTQAVKQPGSGGVRYSVERRNLWSTADV